MIISFYDTLSENNVGGISRPDSKFRKAKIMGVGLHARKSGQMGVGMNLEEIIEKMKQKVKNPKEGLPEEVFTYVSTITPLINVDLLVRNESGAVLMAWRDDVCGQGWHIPGGIIRFKENIFTRIQKVGIQELQAEVKFEKEPMAVNEIIIGEEVRGHFISLLYRCYLPEGYVIDNGDKKEDDAGYLKWIAACPDQFIEGQRKVYSDLWK